MNLERAIAIAARAHEGQVDKAGAPYILHPLRVMLAVKGKQAQMAAVLHDVLEDTLVTAGDLYEACFHDEVIEAVCALTKQPGMSRMDAARKVATNSIAKAVKLADLADNMDISRIAHPTERDYARMREYQQVRDYLLQETV